MGDSAADNAPAKRAPQVGRPPRVNVQDIIAAAIDIGLEGVTLKQVADRLGVAVPTLYRHVRNRDELVRLAAFRVALTRQLPESSEGHWTGLAIDYARSLFDSLVAEPQLIHELMKGRLGPDVELDFLEQFLAALERHGIDAGEGIRLHRAIAMLTIGAAVGVIAVSSSRAEARDRSEAMRLALGERGNDELPHVRRGLDTYLDMDPEQWLPALADLLTGFEAARTGAADAGHPAHSEIRAETRARNDQRRRHAS